MSTGTSMYEGSYIDIINQDGIIHLFTDERGPMKPIILDYRDIVTSLSNCIEECRKNGSPAIIGVEGETASGKTILAEFLTETGRDTLLIHRDISSNKQQRVPLPPVRHPSPTGDFSATFIFDDPEFVLDDSLTRYADGIKKENGIAIFLSRDLNLLPQEITSIMPVVFKLTRDSFRRA